MTTIYDVNPNDLVEKTADKLAEIPEMQPPEWAQFVKTGVHKERPPSQENWWHLRAAAVLRKLSLLGPIGTSKLRTQYGGKKNRGYRPSKFQRGSGNILRKILQQLEKAGLATHVSKAGHKGRIATPKGQSVLGKTASEIAQKKE